MTTKKITWANIKTALDAFYVKLTGAQTIAGVKTLSDTPKMDAIAEKTADTGVTIDGVLIKDSLDISGIVAKTGIQTITGVKTFNEPIIIDKAIGTAPMVITSTTVIVNLNAESCGGVTGATLKANEIIIMADGFKIDGSACELVEADGTAAKCYCKHLAVAKTEWFDVPKFMVPEHYNGGDIKITVAFRSAGSAKKHSLGIRVASVATGEVHNPDLAAAYQLYNEEASDADIGEVTIKTVTVTQANHLMVAGEIWHCKFVMEDDAGADADDVLIDYVRIPWNKG